MGLRKQLSRWSSLVLSAVVVTALGAAPPGGGAPPPPDVAVAFRGADNRLTVARADGSGQATVGTMTYLLDLDWAPAGGPILCLAANNTIYRIQPNGTGQQAIHALIGFSSGLAVTRGQPCPDGQQRIFFTDNPGGGNFSNSNLWTMRLDGTDARALTSGDEYLDGAAVSPLGDRIVAADYVAWLGNEEDIRPDLVLFQLGMVGGQLQVVGRQSLIAGDPGHPLHIYTDVSQVRFEDVSAYNPGGMKIVFRAESPTVSDLYRLDLTNPGSVERIAVPQTNPKDPFPSPDGRYVYYTATKTDGYTSVFRANRDGSGSINWSNPPRRKHHSNPCTKP